MKLGPDVLVEVVSIVQKGLFAQADVSEDLRKLDLVVDEEGKLKLSDEYLEEARKE